MTMATMLSRGRITVPRSVREALGLQAGSRVDFVPLPDGYKVVALKAGRMSLNGRFAGRVEPAVAVDRMDEEIAAGAATRHGRARR